MRTRLLAVAASALLGVFASNAFAEPQPHMRRALELLERARNQLQEATHDKGGHRAKAIEHVELAIAQVREGIEFDNKH